MQTRASANLSIAAGLPSPVSGAGVLRSSQLCPSSPEKKNAAANSTPPDVTQTPTTAVPSGHSPFDLSQIKDYLQRLPDWLKSAATGPGSGAGTPPKQ